MATYHILVAIDGTGSGDGSAADIEASKWLRSDGLNSHVYRFYKDFASPYKVHIPGPGLSGLDVGTIVNVGARNAYQLLGRVMTDKGCRMEDVKINLVGHSRGGFIALKIANLLSNPVNFVAPARAGSAERVKFLSANGQRSMTSLEVNFIGLYDSVKRAGTETEGDLTLGNVKRIAHASRRKESILSMAALTSSRPSFFGMDIPKASTYCLDTSHGGIGGDPGFFTPLEVGNDLYCNALDLVADKIPPSTHILSNPFHSIYSSLWRGHFAKSEEERIVQVRKYYQSSIGADDFVRGEAQQAGVPLGGRSLHFPWPEKYQAQGIFLKTKLRI